MGTTQTRQPLHMVWGLQDAEDAQAAGWKLKAAAWGHEIWAIDSSIFANDAEALAHIRAVGENVLSYDEPYRRLCIKALRIGDFADGVQIVEPTDWRGPPGEERLALRDGMIEQAAKLDSSASGFRRSAEGDLARAAMLASEALRRAAQALEEYQRALNDAAKDALC